MNPLYNTGISLYSLAAQVASLRSPKVKNMLAGQRDTLATLYDKRQQAAPEGYDVWFHAASLGEFEQARPMIERLKAEHPERSILLSFFSPSGYEVRKNYDKVDTVAYLPFDKPRLVEKFLDAAAPKTAIFVKYEFWGNYLSVLQQRNIPTYIISAIFRPDHIFFRPYGGMMRKVLKCFTHLYVQDERSEKLLEEIGIKNVTIAGDTRFDRVTDVMKTTVEFPHIQAWASKGNTLVVGSSWQPDENCYIPYLNDHPAIKAIIAPHEFDEDRISKLRQQLNGRSVRFTAMEKDPNLLEGANYLIVDCFGKLSSLYRYGIAAIVGGGFGTGIHNINEAAVYGIPVLFGPKHQKFKEASDLIECGGGFEYTDHKKLAWLLDTLLYEEPSSLKRAGEAAGRYIREHLGATDLIYGEIFGNRTNAAP